MSGQTIARALQAHFDDVRRTELARLSKKIAFLDEHQRGTAEAIITEVVQGIARRPARVLAANEPALMHAVVSLFGVDHVRDDLPVR